MFVNRDREMKFIRNALSESTFQMIPVWGRRRIGKTTLLLESTDRRSFYFLATEGTSRMNLVRFRSELSQYLDDERILGLELDWENMFRHVSGLNLIIIIDEFPYLVAADSSVPSIFQRIVDLHLCETSTKLFLCGSSERMMESFVLDYKAPLYGRRTGQIKLQSLKFRYLRDFLPDYSFEDLVRVYGMCGGVPLYLKQFDPSLDIWDNVEKIFLNPYSFMYEEESFLLKQEFKNISLYRSILDQMTSGRTKMGEIRESLQLRKSDLSPYIANLRSIGFVERSVPVTDDPSRSRSGLYRIVDHYLGFYYRYILPFSGLIESGMYAGVMDHIRNDLPVFLGRTFEVISREVFLDWCEQNGTHYDKLGPWWFAGDEIDLVGLNTSTNEAIFIEVKWSRKKRTRKDVQLLIGSSKKVRWGDTNTKRSYLYISRGGFSDDCMRWMDEKGILHWDLKDMERILQDDNDV